MRKAFLLAAMTSVVFGCSHPPADEYQEPDGKWSAAMFPLGGASLHETLAGLYKPREGDHRVVIHKIEVVRTDVTPWERIEVKDARENSDLGEGQSFAVIAHRICTAALGKRGWSGVTTDWFMIENNRLSAYTYQYFSYQCLQTNLFRPARGPSIETERELERYIEENFPKSVVLSINVYRKGIKFAEVGRIEDAELALANGDSRFDPTGYNVSARKQGSKGGVIGRSDLDVSRKLLVRAIQHARDGRLNPERDEVVLEERTLDDRVDELERMLARVQEARDAPAQEARDAGLNAAGDEVALEGPTEGDPVDELERLRQETSRRDQERRERWERERELRRFVEVPGGWVLVDEYRRKRGPADGEVWLTLAEMKLIEAEREAEREAARIQKPKESPKAVVVTPEPAQPQPLYVEVDGEWTSVTESQRVQGPRSGEKWVSWDEMQLERISRQLEAARRQKQVASAPPVDKQSLLVELVTEVDGKWRFVTQQERLAGPKEGEIWLTVDEMREEMKRRAAVFVEGR